MSTKQGSFGKWFFKLFLFLAIFIVIDLLVGFTMRKIEYVALKKSPFSMQTDYTIREVQDDVLIFGASEVAHSYIPQVIRDSLQLSVYNCGIDGTPPYYHLAVINSILSRYSPKVIILSVSPMWLSENSNDRLSILNPFYKDYSYCSYVVNKKSEYEFMKCCFNSYLYNSFLYDYLSCIVKPKNDYEYGRYLPLSGTDEDLTLQERDLSEAFPYSPDLAFDFSNTLNICKEKGVKVVLVFTPRYEKSDYSNLENYEQLKNIANYNGAILIEDYYRNPKINKECYFKDFAHLNDDGAKIFSVLLAQRLKTIL